MLDQLSSSELVATVTNSKDSVPPLKSKQVFGIGSQISAPIVPEVEIPSQSPPLRAMSHALPSESPVIVPLIIVALPGFCFFYISKKVVHNSIIFKCI